MVAPLGHEQVDGTADAAADDDRGRHRQHLVLARDDDVAKVARRLQARVELHHAVGLARAQVAQLLGALQRGTGVRRLQRALGATLGVHTDAGRRDAAVLARGPDGVRIVRSDGGGELARDALMRARHRHVVAGGLQRVDHALAGHIRAAIDNGADEYVMKPFDRDTLERKLQLIGLV